MSRFLDPYPRSYRAQLSQRIFRLLSPSSLTATSASANSMGSTGRREQAQEHLATATTMYREMGMTYWREQAEAEFGQFA